MLKVARKKNSNKDCEKKKKKKKKNLLSTGALSTKIHYLNGKYYIKGTTTSI